VRLQYIFVLFAFSLVFALSLSLAGSAVNIDNCQNITVEGEYTVTADATNQSTCFAITTSNVTINCQGHLMRYGANGTSRGHAVTAYNQRNITIENCVFQDANSSGSEGYGIYFRASHNNTISNNTIITNGTGSGHGINFDEVSNTTITDNTIITNGSGSNNYGIALEIDNDVPNNITVSFNSINTYGVSGNHGMNIDGASDIFVLGNNITTGGTANSNEGIRLASASSFNRIINNSINTSSLIGNNNIGIAIEDNNVRNNNISFNLIRTTGPGTTNHGIEVDSTNNSITDNIIITNGTSDNRGINIIGGADGLFLGNNITTNGTLGGNDGIRISSSTFNQIINNSINTSSGSGNNNIGVEIANAASFKNNISNNIIRTNGAGTTNIGIQTSGPNTTARDNIIITNGTTQNMGIRISAGSDGLASRNNITTGGTTGNTGINLVAGQFHQLLNNTITTNARTGSARGITSQTVNTNISFNIISARGTTSDNYGLELTVNSFTVTNNNITTTGGGDSNHGIIVEDARDMNFTDNLIKTNGSTTNYGIYFVSQSSNNVFARNNISTNGTLSYAVFFDEDSNHSIFTDTLLDNPVQWILSNLNTTNNSFTNTTFKTGPGSILFPGAFNISGLDDVNQTNVNISPNSIHVNSTFLPALNISAQITLNNITFLNPNPQVDFADNGTFVNCTPPQCTEVSFNNNVFVFNVSSFTTYQAVAGPLECGNIASSVNLTEDLNSTGTCFTITANDVTLDCAGNAVTYAVTTTGVGVNLSGRTNVTVQNCEFFQPNSSRENSHGALFSNTNSSSSMPLSAVPPT